MENKTDLGEKVKVLSVNAKGLAFKTYDNIFGNGAMDEFGRGETTIGGFKVVINLVMMVPFSKNVIEYAKSINAMEHAKNMIDYARKLYS